MNTANNKKLMNTVVQGVSEKMQPNNNLKS